MGELPDEFPCAVPDWDYIYGLCRDVADQVRADEYDPDVVVALARGGWFGGRCLCDFLGLDDLTSLKMEHYVGTAEAGDGPTVRYDVPSGSLAGKDVLVVDDIADTGQSIARADEYVRERDPASVRTATLQLLGTSEYDPDYVGERLAEWKWVVYPWNFVEDMVDLLSSAMATDGDGPYDVDGVRGLLAEYHDVERMQLETAQPGRVPEVLAEMERRGIVEAAGEGRWQLA